MTTPAADPDELYRLLDNLSTRVGGPRQLNQCHGRMGWAQRGVYFFFEPGETRRNGTPRVVRVGTHALKTGSGTSLWNRLSQHRGNLAGRSPGAGNHRGSIFRLHVGASLLRRDPKPVDAPAHDSWGHRSLAPSAVRALEVPHERRVSIHIGAMPFLWLPVDDPPGPDSDRGRIERGTIALLSALGKPDADPPSPTWLGNHSNRSAVVGSGLWNVNHVHETPSPEVFDLIEHWIQRA